ncbi:MAG TPA: phosphate ABC transporter permease PstA [Terriglobales bacterium]|nr:phosphate ABC transporter permease PstA [Terriglobales bacterium]HUL17409.1 phosphate ABC transporter permease PstA [Terriglobales bacterium]
MTSLVARRRIVDVASKILMGAATAIGVFFLFWIIWTTAVNGISGMHWDLFTKDTPPPGINGYGLRNAFVGSLILLSLSMLIGVPIGVMGGTWLAEYGFHSRIANIVRFLNDIMLSAPSIEIGLFAYAIVVAPMGHFSAFAGSVALSVLMIPIIVRTTDEMLSLVGGDMREAAIALGAPKWVVITKVTWKAARPGILTGILIGLARITGETAPLLFTALNNQFFSADLFHPMANIPVVIFQFALSPYANWQQMAWAAAFITVMFVLVLSLVARWFLGRVQVPK